MEWFICILLLVIGLILIIKGGDWFVDAASWIAEVSGIPRFVIGATIVSIATTLPEILVSSIGAAEGNIGLAIGNAVGSVNANLGLILGISIIAAPALMDRKKNWRKVVILILAVLLLFVFCFTGGTGNNNGELSLWQAIIIIVLFLVYFVENFISIKKESKDPTSMDFEGSSTTPSCSEEDNLLANETKNSAVKIVHSKSEIIKNIILFVLGAGGIIGGAILLNKYGQQLADMAGVPGDIIGVTIVAVGTSLPEFATAVTSIVKKKSDMSIGNIIGANIIDITLILPLCAFIGRGSLPVDAQTIILDLPICLCFSTLALVPPLIFKKFHRWQGALLLAGYLIYIILLVLNVKSVGVIHIF